MIKKVHHVAVVLPDADAALGFYRDVMGLQVTADEVVEEQGVRGVLLQCGENEIELLQPVTPDTGVARYLESRGPTLHHFCFETDDITAELARLKAAGVQLIDESPRRGLAGQIAFIHPSAMHGVLVELAQPPDGAHASNAKGFDHLACYVRDLGAAARTWKDTLGLELTNTIETGRGMNIGQVPSGQCMIELLAPSGPDSPIAKQVEESGERAAPMVAIEVPNLEAEIEKYRAAGIELPEPQAGILPGSRRTNVPPDRTFGLSVQLLDYPG